MIQGKLML
ncbi:hypothetical protein E2C01_056549 [Portunus trituberculatus]|uniref:Uncharacterized protein n=1 Tax=Portunus trituberculatus TaxID=210409 RepID=A0A5B7H0U9_PORTR|nr:hypothetical protein [Portunus trituberculatus]